MDIKDLKILAVDDDKIQRVIIDKLFCKYFEEVIVVESALEALNIIKTQKIDVIITDLNMPTVSGINFIKEIRDVNFTVPIIVITSYVNSDYFLPVMNSNIQAYIEKPITEDKAYFIANKLKLYFENIVNINQKNDDKNIFLDKNIVYDKTNSQIINGDTTFNLSNKESLLLDLLIENKNKLVSFSTIESAVWQKDDSIMTNDALKNVIKSLRNKISKHSIENMPSTGYKIVINQQKEEF